jgi:hypothetical protein
VDSVSPHEKIIKKKITHDTDRNFERKIKHMLLTLKFSSLVVLKAQDDGQISK